MIKNIGSPSFEGKRIFFEKMFVEEMMQEFYVPKLYLSGYLRDFEHIAEQYGLQRLRISKGDTLTRHGEINNTAHYVCSGLLHLALSHSSGNQKSLMFFGPGTVFPIGVVPHENVIDYEMILTALTDMEVYSFSYPMLRRMCVENGELAAQILEENCEMIGYVFYQEMNHAFIPTEIRVCDILYLLMVNLYSNTRVITLRQEELASLVGTSAAQLERVLRQLREQGIIRTARGKIIIEDVQLLLEQCSTELKENG